MSSHPRTIDECGNIMSLHDPDSSDFCRLSPKIPVPFLESDGVCPDILDPCNGLFFLSYRNISMLCNPALREFKVLPPRPSYLRGYNKVLSHHGHGFGFDPVTGSYKVIGICELEWLSSPPEVVVYDSRCNCWRIIDSTHDMLPYIYSFGLFFKGACHSEVYHDDSSRPSVVLSFDASTEVFRHFKFPKRDDGYEKDHHLSILRDRLTLVICTGFSHWPNSSCIDIWAMEEYGVEDSWARTFKIELNGFVRDVFFFWKDEWILVKDKDGVPKSLDLRSGELGRAFTLRGLPYWRRAAVFKESLISLQDVICNAQDG